MDDCSQKRDRRAKVMPITAENNDRKEKIDRSKLKDSESPLEKLMRLIKQPITVSKYAQPITVNALQKEKPKREPIIKAALQESSKASKMRPEQTPKSSFAKQSLQEDSAFKPQLGITGSSLRHSHQKRINPASSVERDNPVPKISSKPLAEELNHYEEMAVSERGNGVQTDAQSSLPFRDVQSDGGAYIPRHRNSHPDGLIEMSSVNCHSEVDPIFTLEEHLNKLAENLSLVFKNRNLSNKEYIYNEVHRFLENFKRFELDSELLVKKELGKYLSLIYSLLLNINDHENELYSKLLPDASALVARIKKQLLAYVDLD